VPLNPLDHFEGKNGKNTSDSRNIHRPNTSLGNEINLL
jgi:hypothetical protein